MGTPILGYQPGGGVPGWIPGLPPTAPGAITGGDITQLVNGQSYIQVVFDVVQANSDWEFVELVVINITDIAPLNIWPGIVTSKLATGFTLQFNGLPDSNNYFLHWSFTGTGGGTPVLPPPVATTYTLSGPSSGYISVASSVFTVALVGGGVASPVTITPAASSGAFTPSTVTLSTGSPSATFTYTPASYGAKTISTTNGGGLTDPASLTYTSVASIYTLTGPSSGTVSVPSTNFTVALPAGGVLLSAVTITPNDSSGGGAFTPTTVNLTTGAPSATFTYTPGSTGAKTIGVTNSGTLTNPGSLTYTSSAGAFDPSTIAGLKLWLKADAIPGPPVDGASLALWSDQSGNGNDVISSGTSQPAFRTNWINGLPAVKFDGVNDNMFGAIPGGVTTAASVFIVQRKNANSGTLAILSNPTSPTNSFAIYLPYSDNNIYFDLGDTTGTGRISSAWGGDYTHFFVWSFVAGGGNMAAYRNGTTVVSSGSHTNSFNPATLNLQLNGVATTVQDAEIAEVLIYNVGLGTTDRTNVENYLRTKYGL